MIAVHQADSAMIWIDLLAKLDTIDCYVIRDSCRCLVLQRALQKGVVDRDTRFNW